MKTLEKHKQTGECAPNNLFCITEQELIKMGYKQRKYAPAHKTRELSHCEENDLLCGTEKARDMWIKLDNRSAKSIDPNRFLVYYI